MALRDVLDFVTAPSPADLRAQGLGAAPYTGNARPSQWWFDGALDLVDWMTQETYSGRSREGYQAGVLDVQFAESRARERGWSGGIAYAVSDGDASDAWPCDEYGRGVSDTATMPYKFYGSTACVGSAREGASWGKGHALMVTTLDGDPGWYPSTWIPETRGVTVQIVGPSPIPDTDLNKNFVDMKTWNVPATPPSSTPPSTSPQPSEDNVWQYQIVDGKDASGSAHWLLLAFGVPAHVFTGPNTDTDFGPVPLDAWDFQGAHAADGSLGPTTRLADGLVDALLRQYSVLQGVPIPAPSAPPATDYAPLKAALTAVVDAVNKL